MGRHEQEFPASPRRATNVSLDEALVNEARAPGINLSRACEGGLADAIARERSRRWRAENSDALASSNAHAEAHGLPLAGHRPF